MNNFLVCWYGTTGGGGGEGDMSTKVFKKWLNGNGGNCHVFS